MDKRKIEGIRHDVNSLLSRTVLVLKEMETEAYEDREIDLMKPISAIRNDIQSSKIKIIKGLDKLSKIKSNW